MDLVQHNLHSYVVRSELINSHFKMFVLRCFNNCNQFPVVENTTKITISNLLPNNTTTEFVEIWHI
jgi:hypothetical protein